MARNKATGRDEDETLEGLREAEGGWAPGGTGATTANGSPCASASGGRVRQHFGEVGVVVGSTSVRPVIGGCGNRLVVFERWRGREPHGRMLGSVFAVGAGGFEPSGEDRPVHGAGERKGGNPMGL